MPGQVARADAGLAACAAEARPVVVKLGGSVVRSGALAPWLDAIAAATCPVVVVPGGGALADEVRACQAQLGFGDRAAHRMALLAMDQLAWAVAGLRPGFAIGATEQELWAALQEKRVAVWAPYSLIAERTDIEASWRLTSDSLALWLAGRLGARACYLIKSVARRGTSATAAALSREGIVDAAFPEMLKQTSLPTFMLGRGEQGMLGAFLAGQAQGCGAAVD